ncbi:hypothetical protein EW146_g8673, partial [Bondarzewia mesenterica]
MGSASSKAARTLPKTAAKPPPSWAGARTPGPSDVPPRAKPQNPRASETKDEDIERDSRDPQFLANLRRLGPVRVDHHMQTIRTADDVNRAYRSRVESETAASSSRVPHNRLLVDSLTDLLEERKLVTTQGELEELARRYGIDVDKLESLARFVNTPSVKEGSVVRVIEDNGDELITRT